MQLSVVTEYIDSWDKKNYLSWFHSRPFGFKWILWIILVFPIVATTWELKKIVGISPLQVLGVGVFVFAFFSGFKIKTVGKRINPFFYLFLLLFCVNHVFVFLFEGTFSQFADSVRAILPFVLFFYFRRIISSIQDIEGFLITFLISCIFPIVVLYYEILFEPIRYVYNTESRGGGLRLSGFFADLFGYMSYLICGFISYCYFYIRNIRLKYKSSLYSSIGFLFILLVFLVGIYNLRHQASWAVSISIISLFVFFIRKSATTFQTMLMFLIFVAVGTYFYLEIFEVLYAKDINVYTGDARDSAALNGRMWIWERYFAYWFEYNSLSHLLGVGFAQHFAMSTMISGGMHNDYVRFFFTTGIVGMIAYVIFLLSLFIKAIKIRSTEVKFLIISCLLVMSLYSISALPLLSSGALMYFVLAIISQIPNARK